VDIKVSCECYWECKAKEAKFSFPKSKKLRRACKKLAACFWMVTEWSWCLWKEFEKHYETEYVFMEETTMFEGDVVSHYFLHNVRIQILSPWPIKLASLCLSSNCVWPATSLNIITLHLLVIKRGRWRSKGYLWIRVSGNKYSRALNTTATFIWCKCHVFHTLMYVESRFSYLYGVRTSLPSQNFLKNQEKI
jgi:hypothetical protein